jgi:hypothetical protein
MDKENVVTEAVNRAIYWLVHYDQAMDPMAMLSKEQSGWYPHEQSQINSQFGEGGELLRMCPN